MIPVVRLEEVIAANPGKTGHDLIGEAQGCVNGCRCGVSIYTRTEFDEDGGKAHLDQEGFFVLEGRGVALIDGEELILEPGMSFVIPAGVQHTMKRSVDSECCKVFWFHAAI